MRPDEYLDDDEEESFSSRSIFASGWFRALMVLGVLGIVLVVTLPYAFKWMEAPKPVVAKRDTAPSSEARPAPAMPSAVPVTVPTPGPPPAAAEKSVATPAPTPSAQTVTAPAPDPAPVKPLAEKPTPEKPTTTVKLPAEPTPSDKPAGAAKAAAEKPGAAKATAEKPATKPAAMAEATVGAATPVRKNAAAPAAKHATADKGGDFYVQVGVFQDERNAERLAKTLRDKHLPVHVTKVTREAAAAPTTRHEVFVAGANPQVVNAALRGNGSALPVRGGVAVQPSLELKEAVALSRKLSGEGLNVQIRRVGGDTGPAPSGARHLVRVGGYATRAEAQTVRNQLKRDGINAFVTPVATR